MTTHATNRAEALAMLTAGMSSTDPRLIHPKCIEALDLYGREGRPVGGFLRASLENDFVSAAWKADDQNQIALPAVICYIYGNLPANCHSSPRHVREWIAAHRKLREALSARPTVEPAPEATT